jgi:hypothetical protein
MSKMNNSPRRTREEIAQSAALGPYRKHGEVPPTEIKLRSIASSKAVSANGGAGTREHAATPIVDQRPNYNLRRAIAAGTGLIAISTTAVGVGSVVEGLNDDAPRPKITVIAEPGDSVWELQRNEATNSGVHPEVDIRSEIDEAVKLNGGPTIRVGEPVILIDIPNKPGSPQADAEQRQQIVDGATVATNEQISSTQPSINDIP